MMSPPVSLSYIAFGLVSLATFFSINYVVPEPYMDEIFHIPQAQQYCRGDFSTWDPKLTTPPGLYLLSLLPAKLLRLSCDSVSLYRATNFVLLLAFPFVIRTLLTSEATSSRRIKSTSSPGHLVEAITIACFPPLWFFGSLYYTDVGGCFFVLSSWAAAKRNKHWLASGLGLVSLTFRQTNIVWLGFIMGDAVLSELDSLRIVRFKDQDESKLRREVFARDFKTFGSFVHEIVFLLPGLVAEPDTFTPVVLPYIPTFLAFAYFIHWNGGIVLGHKEMHVATIHLPQTAYFFGFSTALAWPVLLNQGGLVPLLRRGLRDAFGGHRQLRTTIALLTITTLAVKHFTIAHPFLLADNRHYAFYVWRRLLNVRPPYSRYAFVPLYVGAMILWGGRLLRTTPPLRLLLWLGATLVTLTPTPLIEPRYFVLPFLVLRVLASRKEPPSPPSKKKKYAKAKTAAADGEGIWVEAAWYALINAVTVGVFLRRTFLWEGEPGWQRFMW